MEHLPEVLQPEVLQPAGAETPEEIFVNAEPKPKRQYKRDPVEMAAHMAKMREKSAEARRRKKVSPGVSPAVSPAVSPGVTPAGDFDTFMQHYSKVEEYKNRVAEERREREEYIEAQVEKRLKDSKKHETTSPFDVYFN